MVIKVQTISL